MKSINYRKIYKSYAGKPKQIKHRSSRNKARRKMISKLGHAACRNKDVDHIDHNPLNNNLSNLRLRSVRSNRADNQKP